MINTVQMGNHHTTYKNSKFIKVNDETVHNTYI